SNSISIHIRRGDYISNQEANNFHGSCSIDYYTEAINIIKGKVSNPIFFVFSDDIAWVKENLKSDIVATWVSEYNLDNTEDLLLMSFCKHQIIANSSFSWWGAYLNRNINKIVIAPKKWIANKGYNTDEITPSSWIKL
ncbi:MAG: alpha-1,2-fucosyltransferase, partial [bacterium]